jgi:nucleoside-diphosphate-sugar epimerase
VDGIRHTLTLDCSRARKELGWVPRHNARDTLAQM